MRDTGRACEVYCVALSGFFVLREFVMDPVAKRGRSEMWEHFHLISPNKVDHLFGFCSAAYIYLFNPH